MSATVREVRVAEHAGLRLPVAWLHTHSLAEQGNEDLGFFLTKAGKDAQTRGELARVGDPGPDVLTLVLVLRGDDAAELVDAPAHRGRKAVYGGFLAADGHEVVDVHRGDLLRVEVAEALLQRGRAVERPLHRNLLIEKHADQQRGAVRIQQLVGGGVARDVEGSHRE